MFAGCVVSAHRSEVTISDHSENINATLVTSKGKWVTAATISDTYTWNPADSSPSDTYTRIVSGEKGKITKSAYDSTLRRYTTGTKTDLFSDGFGLNSFDFDTNKNNQVIRAFLRNLISPSLSIGLSAHTILAVAVGFSPRVAMRNRHLVV